MFRRFMDVVWNKFFFDFFLARLQRLVTRHSRAVTSELGLLQRQTNQMAES